MLVQESTGFSSAIWKKNYLPPSESSLYLHSNNQSVTPCLLTYLLTYSMLQRPSWETNWFAANQEIPRISRNKNVYYRTHKLPPPVSILGQPNPVHHRITYSYVVFTES